VPLKVMDVVEQRLRVVVEVESGRLSVRQAAQRFEVSKSQVYEWLGRYRADGVEGLVPRSRRPVHSPAATPAQVEEEIVRLHKQRLSRWGAKKIRTHLARQGITVPAVSTVHEILIRRGRIMARPRARRDGGQRFERPFCNDLWQIDGTQHRLVNGREFWVVDILDDKSRFLLAAAVGPCLTGTLAWQALRGAVADYGLPRQLLSDNGTTFTGRLNGYVVYFERQVRAAGVEFIHGRAYHPQTQGKLERQHGTQNTWLADHRPRSLTAAQNVLDAYRADYNHVRPHEALGQRPPAELYQPGRPVQLPPIELEPADAYPPEAIRRHIDRQGRLTYGGKTFHVEQRWADLPVGLIRQHHRLLVFYGSAEITSFDVGDMPHPNRARYTRTQQRVRHVPGT
jgi:transposase InsO family protein